MNTIVVLLFILGFTSYQCTMSGKNFAGSSSVIKNLFSISGSVGYIAFFVFVIWSFFIIEWWIPVVTVIVTAFVSGILSALFDRLGVIKIVVDFLSVAGIVLSSIFLYTEMIK